MSLFGDYMLGNVQFARQPQWFTYTPGRGDMPLQVVLPPPFVLPPPYQGLSRISDEEEQKIRRVQNFLALLVNEMPEVMNEKPTETNYDFSFRIREKAEKLFEILSKYNKNKLGSSAHNITDLSYLGQNCYIATLSEQEIELLNNKALEFVAELEKLSRRLKLWPNHYWFTKIIVHFWSWLTQGVSLWRLDEDSIGTLSSNVKLITRYLDPTRSKKKPFSFPMYEALSLYLKWLFGKYNVVGQESDEYICIGSFKEIKPKHTRSAHEIRKKEKTQYMLGINLEIYADYIKRRLGVKVSTNLSQVIGFSNSLADKEIDEDINKYFKDKKRSSPRIDALSVEQVDGGVRFTLMLPAKDDVSMERLRTRLIPEFQQAFICSSDVSYTGSCFGYDFEYKESTTTEECYVTLTSEQLKIFNETIDYYYPPTERQLSFSV